MNTHQTDADKQYAIFKTGGKQYQAVIGKTLAVEKLEGLAGDKIDFKEVLLLKTSETDVKFGKPFIAGCSIKASIIKQSKGPKLVIYKFKRRKKYRVKTGHRQPITVVRFESF